MTDPADALISLWGGHSDPRCFLQAFMDVVEERPDDVAVVDGRRSVTYTQLLGWVRAVADLLADYGVAPTEPVAVTGPRSAHTVAAMLGITWIGAVFVPLDPDYPERRLEFMIHDCGARLLLHSGGVPELGRAAVTRIAIPHSASATGDRTGVRTGQAPVNCHPDLPFYMIYTSGSTGWPKGVSIPHSCLDNMAEWQANHSPRPDLRTAQFAPLNFDVSFQEILGTLRGGGTLVVMPEHLRREAVSLLTWLGEHRIERLFLPYVALQMLAVAASAEPSLDHLRLREVNTAGEQVVTTRQIRDLFRRLPGARLVNHYGQSESAMVTSHILPTDVNAWPLLPPIGVPLPGCEVLVARDGRYETGVGELLVAGLPLALGYLNQPELNAERYRTMKPTPRGHTEVFHTGDLVRVEDGVLSFLSRLDTDVKIRGIRVNLAEVDAQLLTQPGVDSAACVVLEGVPGSRTLRAAVTAPTVGPEPDLASVAEHLRRVLPEAALPLSITLLPELPCTPSGKTDRDAVGVLILDSLRARRLSISDI